MVSITITDIEWDAGNLQKCQKHGVPLKEIESILTQDGSSIVNDSKHNDAEKRYIAVGTTTQKRYVFVVFTFRSVKGNVFIRPLSARYMHKKEIESYEKVT